MKASVGICCGKLSETASETRLIALLLQGLKEITLYAITLQLGRRACTH